MEDNKKKYIDLENISNTDLQCWSVRGAIMKKYQWMEYFP